MKLTSPSVSKRMAHLSDDQVLANLGSVIGSRRKITAQLVAYLGEVEARRLHLREACASMYEFCCRKLELSEGSAHRHIAAARIARKYPMVLDLLREGRIHVTALSMLQTYLKVENRAELLAAACNKSKAEVELLIRSRFPKKDVADSIRPVPVQAQLGGGATAVGQSGAVVASQTVRAAGQLAAADTGPAAGAPAAANRSAGADAGLATAERSAAGQPAEATSGHWAAEPRSRVTPLSAQRFHIQFSAGSALKDKLERAIDLMSHSNPKRDLATVIERGLDLVLADLEKKVLGKTDRPRRSAGTKNGSFSRQARREIYERDGEQCTYTSPSGERCRARAFVQLDHYDPRALGGPGTTRNGRLLCRAHNLFEAEKAFGRKYVENRIRLRQQRLGCESRRGPEQSSGVQAGVGVGAHSPEESSVEKAGEVVGLDSVGNAIHLRQLRQHTSDCESGREHGPTSGPGNAESTLDDAPSVHPGNADPSTLVDAPSCHPGNAGKAPTSNAFSCASNDGCELRASESPRCLEQLAGGATDLGSELSLTGNDEACVHSSQMESKLVSALTNMGFRRGESKKAVAALAWQGDTHGQRAEDLAALLRRALAILVP